MKTILEHFRTHESIKDFKLGEVEQDVDTFKQGIVKLIRETEPFNQVKKEV